MKPIEIIFYLFPAMGFAIGWATSQVIENLSLRVVVSLLISGSVFALLVYLRRPKD